MDADTIFIDIKQYGVGIWCLSVVCSLFNYSAGLFKYWHTHYVKMLYMMLYFKTLLGMILLSRTHAEKGLLIYVWRESPP